MTTAGAEGFQNLLPIYLDHILYPTITDSGFTTEVHHINGNGMEQLDEVRRVSASARSQFTYADGAHVPNSHATVIR